MITVEQIHICLYAIDLRNILLTLVVLLKRCTFVNVLFREAPASQLYFVWGVFQLNYNKAVH